ncbi:MAG: hypothetical protein ABSG95_09815 [Solirubrobacteraceae bacterium]|jgi:hypothetical protein
MSLRRISPRAPLVALAALLALALLCGPSAARAGAQGPEWRLEQPRPPAPPQGVPGSEIPIGLGRIGDIEFWAPNRGLLITSGNAPSIPPGLWAYDGESWHELSTVCGATDGRIAWAGPEEFWTVSDGRPGQAANPQNGEPAPIQDNTLCHFSGGEVVGSFASLAFSAGSYQPMHAAACFGPSDCWFGGDPLPEPQVGAFHLHWNGSSLSAEANPQGHAVEAMRMFDGRLFESVRLSAKDLLSERESPEHPSVLHEISPENVQPTFLSLLPQSPASHKILPEYIPGEYPEALDFLRLSADEEGLWGAAGPASEVPGGSSPAGVTVIRYAIDPEGQQLSGTELLGPETSPSGEALFPGDVVKSIAADPETGSAWIALDSQADSQSPSPTAKALLARISANGTVSEVQTLPSAAEAEAGVAPKGAAETITCPAREDCWLATTQGWLFHLSEGGSLPRDTDPAFAGLITYRPPDQGVPQVLPDAPPIDDSGLLGEAPASLAGALEVSAAPHESRVTVPLLSGLHSRIVKGSTLELRFRLAARARVRLLAKRRRTVVASTPTHTFSAGSRKLLLVLNPRRWPTKLDLQTRALAPLPTVSTRSNSVETVSTSLAFPFASSRGSISALPWARPAL